MFAGSMRGPRMKTPLLLLLLLLTALTGTGVCQDEYDGADPDTDTPEEEAVVPEPDVETELSSEPSDPEATAAPEDPPPDYPIPEEDPGSGHGNETFDLTLDGNATDSTEDGGDTESLSLIIILIPVVLVVVIISMIVCGIFINRRCNQKARNQGLRKEDPYLDGSSTEKVPMPMFEEDVPSVLELEMEDFDQWMKKDVEPVEDSIHA
ncbi:transmembrane protein 154 [Clinocottus analis]|uniref:transmembrane protein 154 n=1 Tax=Clinocottus analis TaxID=304258 RepID=UPI0035C064CC